MPAMPAINSLRQLFQRLPLSNITVEQLFIRMALNLGPEEREQLNVKASKGQCPMRQLLPEKNHKRR